MALHFLDLASSSLLCLIYAHTFCLFSATITEEALECDPRESQHVLGVGREVSKRE